MILSANARPQVNEFRNGKQTSYNMPQQKLKTALILGASGLVGQQLLQLLLDDERYQQITCLVRKPLPWSLTSYKPEKLQSIQVDFRYLEDYQGYFAVDHVYVCLGSTLKKAGSKTAFRDVDFSLVYAAAEISRGQQAGSFVWISSVGANPKSASFYLRVKGELEQAIFNLSGLKNAATVRPSLLLGQRQESRVAEQLGIRIFRTIAPILLGPFKKYRPVSADTVARQMCNLQVW